MKTTLFQRDELSDEDLWEETAHFLGQAAFLMLTSMIILGTLSGMGALGKGYYDLTLGNPKLMLGGPISLYLLGYLCTRKSKTYGYQSKTGFSSDSK